MPGTNRPYFWSARKAWYINVRINGKLTKRKLGDTKQEAYDVWKQTIKTSILTRENPTFSSVSTKWLAKQLVRFERKEVSAAWIERISRTVEQFTRLGKRCSEFTPLFLDDWSGQKSSNYIRTEAAVLIQIFDWAVENDLLEKSPLAAFKLPPSQSRDRILSIQEHNRLCQSAGSKFKPVLRFAWMTGCRPGELRSLRWEHVSTGFERAILVEHKTARKTGKPRVIYFSPRAQRLLRQYAEIRGTVRAFKRGVGYDYVFVNHHRKPWSKNAIVCRMRALRKTTGLDLVAYNYRHTWITRAILSGIDIATVSALSGTSIEMISRVYAHVLASVHGAHLSEAASKVNRM